MSPVLVVSILALLTALVAAWAALRPRAADPAPLEALRRGMTDELARQRRDVQADTATALAPLNQALLDLGQDLAATRSELGRTQSEALAARFNELAQVLQDSLRAGRQEQGAQLVQVLEQVQARLEAIRMANETKLEEMRRTVDEKLHDTLEKRLGESFSLVSQRLEQVQKGLGEMQSLASDVGGLKRALTNVKTRGVMGEAQLAMLLEQYLEAGQYEANVKVKPRSNELVEFAVKLPEGLDGGHLWLPIDAKFPIEDYQRLMEAYEAGSVDEIARHAQALENRLLTQAREIRDRYVEPPHTTNFALMFLPFEGLYAEALRRPGLLQRLQADCKVTLVGPTTLTAFLNSLQMGFRSLKISKNTTEIAKTLGAVKTEFGKFGEAVDAVQKKLEEAGTKLGVVGDRSRQMARKLSKVEALGEAEAQEALGFQDEENS
ncbi:MAG: DNA recombination protein RmuC [Holophagaceae bacterium]